MKSDAEPMNCDAEPMNSNATVLSKSNENEFRRTSANYAYFGEKNCELSATFWTSIVEVAVKFRELGERMRQNFKVLNESSHFHS